MSIQIRRWEKSDAPRLAELANNMKIAKYLTNRFPYPYTLENAHSFIEMFTKDEPTRFFAITLKDEVIGATGIHLQEDVFINNAELGYWIGEPYWGKGYMSEAIKLVADHAFKTFSVTRLYGRVYGNNPKSMKVLEKAGFILEAKFDKTLFKNGEVLDEYIYAKRRSL